MGVNRRKEKDQTLPVCPCGVEPEWVHNVFAVHLCQGATRMHSPPTCHGDDEHRPASGRLHRGEAGFP